MDMDIQKHMQLVRRMMTDNTPLPVMISIKEAWMLISGLQLASRHSGISPYTKTALEAIGRQFQQAIVEHEPEVTELIEMGWNPAMDQTSERIYISPSAKQRLIDEFGLTEMDFEDGHE